MLRSSLTEVDEQRNVRTKATFGDAVNAWIRMHAVNENPRRQRRVGAAISLPALGDLPLTPITAQLLEKFYADLRRCCAAATSAVR